MLRAVGECRCIRALAPEGQPCGRALMDLARPIRIGVLAGERVSHRGAYLCLQISEPGHKLRLLARGAACAVLLYRGWLG